jgi:hypothetical protein
VDSDKEFQKHETKRVAGLREQERTDFTAELNDTDNGRMKKFGLSNKARQEETRKAREKHTLSQALRISASYAKLYQSTMQDLHDATSLVYEAQVKWAAELGAAQTLLKQTIEQATKTPDGTAVFRSQDGNVYNQHGQKMDDEALVGVLWHGRVPSWESYQERFHDVEFKQERLNQMNTHEIRLGELQVKMEDEDNPLTTDELKAVKSEIQDIMNDAKTNHTVDAELTIQKPLPAAVPELNF